MPPWPKGFIKVEQPTRPASHAVELAVLDAPVLARGVLTLILLHLAQSGAFDPVWSDQIHADWTRDLQRARPGIPLERMRQRRVELDHAFPVANVIASRDVQDEVLAHCTTAAERKSAHVLVTALSARAAVIVTDASFCLTAVMAKVWHDTAVLSADEWCVELLDAHEEAVLDGCRAHRASLLVTRTPEEWLTLLREPNVSLPGIAGRLTSHRDRL